MLPTARPQELPVDVDPARLIDPRPAGSAPPGNRDPAPTLAGVPLLGLAWLAVGGLG